MSIFHKKSIEKDLDGWIGKHIKAVLNNEGSYYEGILIEEQKNGVMVECSGKRIYIPYESLLVIGEI